MAVQKDGGKESALPSGGAKAENINFPVNGRLQEGIRLYRTKRWDKALDEFLSTGTDDFTGEDRMELAYYLGLCYTKLEQYDEALLYLEQVVTSGGDVPAAESGVVKPNSLHSPAAGSHVLRIYQCRMTLAYIYIVTKRTKMAEFELNKLQNSGFESPLLYNTLAYAAWTQKRSRSAIELYEKALEIDTNNATAMNSMGYILADTGIDNLRGLRLCRKAVDAKPQSAAYLDSLGWAYYKSGEVVEARIWLRRALDIAPDEKEIQNHFKIVTGAAV